MNRQMRGRIWMGIAWVAACLGWTGASGAETASETEVRKAMEEVVGAASRLDDDGIMARLDTDAAARYCVQGQAFNHDDLAVFLRQSFADMKSQEVIWLQSAARELAPGIVLWESYGRNPVVEAGGREIEYLLGETWIWKKTDDVWRAIHYHESFLEMPSQEKRRQVEDALAEFASTFTVGSRNPMSVMPALEAFVASREPVAGAAFAFAPAEGVALPVPYVSRKGGEIVRKLIPADSGYAQSDWYAGPAGSGKPSWSEPYFDSYGAERMMITYSVPIKDEAGVLLGVLTADLALY